MKRRTALVGLGALFTGACSKIAESRAGQSLFDMTESWHLKAHRALADRQALAPEFSKADISPVFKGNGSVTVVSDIYRYQLAKGFPDWRLRIGGLVKKEMSLSLEELRALPQRTQITRHDCVEGWSAIGEWTGPQLSHILDEAEVLPEARPVAKPSRTAPVVAAVADRPRQLPPMRRWARWAPIRAAACASRRHSAAWWA